jgi:3-hydroxyacyl-CoA dehydrogenase
MATPHDVTVAGHLATVLTGGDADLIDEVPDTAIRDLERAAFMALFRTKESQARIKHILDTGKPLRN